MAAKQPVIWKNPDISPDDLDYDSLKVIRRLRRFGYRPYYAGGCVRDILLDHHPNDYDIVSDARPEDVRNVFRNCRVIGRRFRLAHIFFSGKIIEVSTFRASPDQHADDSQDDLYLRSQNTYGTPREDARNRDFTINGLFFDPIADEIVDYVGGLEDLRARLLRTIGDPFQRFQEDPVRMMRAIKYSGRLDLEIEAQTARALSDCRGDLDKCSRARLLDETLKLVRGRCSTVIFEQLLEYGLLEVLCPTLSAFLESSPEEECFWRLLETLSGLDPELRDRLHSSVLMSVLLYPYLKEGWAKAGLLQGKLSQAVLIRHSGKLLTGISEKLALPRKLSLSVRQVCVMQAFLERGSMAPARLARRESFAEALSFLELRSVAGDVEPERLRPYQRWLDGRMRKPEGSSRNLKAANHRPGRRKRRHLEHHPREHRTVVEPPSSQVPDTQAPKPVAEDWFGDIL